MQSGGRYMPDDAIKIITFLALYTAVACAVCYFSERRAQKRAVQQQPQIPSEQCVQEAERVLFRYQYRLSHGQAPVDEQP